MSSSGDADYHRQKTGERRGVSKGGAGEPEANGATSIPTISAVSRAHPEAVARNRLRQQCATKARLAFLERTTSFGPKAFSGQVWLVGQGVTQLKRTT